MIDGHSEPTTMSRISILAQDGVQAEGLARHVARTSSLNSYAGEYRDSSVHDA